MMEKDFLFIVSDYSERIQKNISEGEWDSLNDLLGKRQQALEKFFSNLDRVEGKENVVEVIKKIQVEDISFLRLVQSQKQAMEKQYTMFKKGRKSVKAYQAL